MTKRDRTVRVPAWRMQFERAVDLAAGAQLARNLALLADPVSHFRGTDRKADQQRRDLLLQSLRQERDVALAHITRLLELHRLATAEEFSAAKVAVQLKKTATLGRAQIRAAYAAAERTVRSSLKLAWTAPGGWVLPAYTPRWRIDQRHHIGADARQPLRKSTGQTPGAGGAPPVEEGLVEFPRRGGFGGSQLPLRAAAPAQSGGRTITAYDPASIVDRHPTAAGSWMSGYGKMIVVTGLPNNCTVQFRTVKRSTQYALPRNGTAWTQTPGEDGSATADPAGGQAGHVPVNGAGAGAAVPGTSVFADFPNSHGANLGVFVYRTCVFRTWVVELCPPAQPKVLGYMEWGFTVLLEFRADGSCDSRPKPAGGQPPAPPGGWPANVPETKTPTWVDDANAPQDAKADYAQCFP